MAERINQTLLGCVRAPRFTPYVCMTNSVLTELVEEIKGLNNEEFLKVHNYATTLELPPNFLKELDKQYKSRGFKS